MLTIFNPYTLLHYLTSTFINNSNNPPLPPIKLVEEKSQASFCVFSKNCVTFELHLGVRTSATESRFCICSILLALAGGGILALQV